MIRSEPSRDIMARNADNYFSSLKKFSSISQSQFILQILDDTLVSRRESV